MTSSSPSGAFVLHEFSIGGLQDVASCEVRDDLIARKFCDISDNGTGVVRYVFGNDGLVHLIGRISTNIHSKNKHTASHLKKKLMILNSRKRNKAKKVLFPVFASFKNPIGPPIIR